MQRSTALKWEAALRTTPAQYDTAQIGMRIGDTLCLSPVGVLCAFLDPEGFATAWDGVTQTWHGQIWSLPPAWTKSCKMKGDIWDLYAASDQFSDFHAFADWLVEETEPGVFRYQSI